MKRLATSPLVTNALVGGAALLLLKGVVDFSRGEPTRGMVLGALLASGAMAVGLSLRRPQRASNRHVGPLALMWIVLTLGPLHSIVRRSIHDAVNSLGADSTVEVLVYALIGAWCVTILRDLVHDPGTLRLPPLFIALPALAIASATWSTAAAYSLGRGMQMAVVSLLAVTTLAVRDAGGSADEILERYLHYFVRVVLALILLRLALGPHYVLVNESNEGRFALIGMHPNSSAFITAIAIVVVMFRPERQNRRLLARVAPLSVFVPALLAMHSRTALIVLGAGFVTVGFVHARRSPTFRHRAATPVLAAIASAAILFWGSVYDYALRGSTSDELTDGHGRLELWQEVPGVLETPFDWLVGLGWGQANLAFIDEISWANSAHNSLLSVLVELGLVGAGVFVLVLARTVAAAVRSPIFGTRAGPVIAGLLAMLFVQMSAADTLAGPYGGLVMVHLLMATSWPGRGGRAGARAAEHHRSIHPPRAGDLGGSTGAASRSQPSFEES